MFKVNSVAASRQHFENDFGRRWNPEQAALRYVGSHYFAAGLAVIR